MNVDEFLELMGEAEGSPDLTTRLGTVAALPAGGGATVTFDGESGASAKAYPRAVSVSVGDRVALLRVGSTWVVALNLTAPAGAGGGVQNKIAGLDERTEIQPISDRAQAMAMITFRNTGGPTGGFYASIFVSPWMDDSGGGVHELGLAGDGNFYRRYGTTSGGWGPWKRVDSPEAWITPAFLNGWLDYSTGYNSVGYRKDAQGLVHLKGLVRSGTIGAAIFNLPAGYRPSRQVLMATISNSAIGRCDVTTGGDVNATNGSNAWFSLDGLSFWPD